MWAQVMPGVYVGAPEGMAEELAQKWRVRLGVALVNDDRGMRNAEPTAELAEDWETGREVDARELRF